MKLSGVRVPAIVGNDAQAMARTNRGRRSALCERALGSRQRDGTCLPAHYFLGKGDFSIGHARTLIGLSITNSF
jgi:hypothetical protein